MLSNVCVSGHVSTTHPWPAPTASLHHHNTMSSPAPRTSTAPAPSVDDDMTLADAWISGMDDHDAECDTCVADDARPWQYTSSRHRDWDNAGYKYAELGDDYWFQLADQYNVSFAIARVQDLRSGKYLIIDLLHTLVLTADDARPRLAQLADEFTGPELLDPPIMEPIERLVALAAPQDGGTSIEEWLVLVSDACEVGEALACIMEPHTSRESRVKVACGLKEMLTRLIALVDEGIVRIWEIVENEELLFDEGVQDRTDHWLDYDVHVIPAIKGYRACEEGKTHARERVAARWGDDWMGRLDPTGRWLLKGSVAFWAQLADVAESGAELGAVRMALDDGA